MLFTLKCEDGHNIDVESADGGIVTVRPLGWDGWHAARRGEALPLNLDQVTVNMTGPEHQLNNQPANISFVFEPKHKPVIFGLVPEGWLPAGLVQANLLLPDSNIAGKFSLFKAEQAAFQKEPSLRLLHLGTQAVHPLLAAMEGGQRRFMGRDELQVRARQVAERLCAGFPDTEVVSPDELRLEGIWGLLEDYRQDYPKRSAFLKSVLPLLLHRVSESQLPARLDEVTDRARRNSVPLGSFLHLVVVDCLCDEGPVPKNQQHPGRLLLKPKEHPTDQDLYNALFDILQLELLCAAQALYTPTRVALCTMDKGLAGAWAMLRPYEAQVQGRALHYRYRPENSFAVRLTGESREQLFRLIGQR